MFYRLVISERGCGSMVIKNPNHKFQKTNKSQRPNSKFQTAEHISFVWKLKFENCLEFGAWVL
jgi:hypothetical protein